MRVFRPAEFLQAAMKLAQRPMWAPDPLDLTSDCGTDEYLARILADLANLPSSPRSVVN